MIELKRDAWSHLAPLFAGHRRRRCYIDSILEGYTKGFGGLVSVWADAEQNPQIVQLDLHTHSVFGGDALHPALAQMLQRLPTTVNWLKGLDGFCGHWITPKNQLWNQRILELLGSKAIRQTRIEYSADHINVEELQPLQTQLPSGYRLERLTMGTVRQRGYDLDRMGLGYVSIRDFLEQGLSFRIMKENERVAEAYSAVRSRSGMEVSIGTEPAYRRMGLAKAVGAAFTLECLNQELTPHWSTLENSHSDRLAEKLGYTPRDRHDVLGKAE